ncbi:MAG: gamma-glutamyl-gamma-aminobutyrate hydrolase family protein [Tannerellaceae bacterium]|nr:gamma-glutamyl-gamma-aminobutyrate hydrolase family protein [Tannerellaceae bacterium]
MKVRFPNAEELFREADGYLPSRSDNNPPRIGISSNRKDGLSCIAETYVQSITLAGGAPVLIPVITDVTALAQIVEILDGLIMTGGGDLNPLFVGEEPVPELQDVDPYRDAYDFLLLRLALNRQIPVFGICRGHQLLNVAFGGTIYQDIYSQSDSKLLKHSQTIAREYASHTVQITAPDSKLFAIFDGETSLQVNSFHHQAVRTIAPEFIETAVSPDSINEAMEHPERYIFSVQWHPEAMAANGNEEMLKLFRYHIKEAKIYRKAKEIHTTILTVDSHTDTPTVFKSPYNLGLKENSKVNLPLMEEGKIDAAFMVAYLPQGERDEVSLEKSKEDAISILSQVKEQVGLNRERMGIACNTKDLIRLKSENKKAVFLGIENGYAVGKDIHNLSLFKKMGVTYITLCHNGSNDICDSAKGNPEWNGLSAFGKDVVKEMNRLGIMVDISHAAESTFYDVLKESKVPVIASHSSCRALCDHPRNLTDEQIKALAAAGGVIQICLYQYFINRKGEEASLSDAIRHINHVVNLVGIDHVGVGSDFDGDGELIGCRNSAELINITMRLIEEGYTEEDIRKIWGGNLLRVMDIVQAFPNNLS